MEAYSAVKATPYLSSDKTSLAYLSVKDLWPKIVVSIGSEPCPGTSLNA